MKYYVLPSDSCFLFTFFYSPTTSIVCHLCTHGYFTLLYMCLIDSDEASVGNEELNRTPKDGIIVSLISLSMFC